jgi:O-antigen ligase
LNIFDNQYLGTAVELGTVGTLAMLVFFLVPAFAAVAARRMSASADLRLACSALAASAMVVPVASFTFDSLSFPMFVNVYALVIGLTGACSRLAAAERARAQGTARPAGVVPIRFELPAPGGFRPRRAPS